MLRQVASVRRFRFDWLVGAAVYCLALTAVGQLPQDRPATLPLTTPLGVSATAQPGSSQPPIAPGQLVVDVIIEELIGLIGEDAEALGCLPEVEAAREIVANGNSADRQRRVFKDALGAELPVDEALRSVVRHLIDEFHVGL